MVSASALRWITSRATSAIIRPSTKMPWPPNMRRTDTGPNSRKSSGIVSASISAPSKSGYRFCVRARENGVRTRLVRFGGGQISGRRQLHRLPTAAGRGLVRIVEHEGRGQFVHLEVHFGAKQEQNGFRVDQQFDALVLDDFIELRRFGCIFHRVGHTGAAPVLHANAYTRDRLVGLRDDRLDTVGGCIGEPHDLGSGSCRCHLSSHSDLWRIQDTRNAVVVYLGTPKVCYNDLTTCSARRALRPTCGSAPMADPT